MLMVDLKISLNQQSAIENQQFFKSTLQVTTR